MSIDTDARDRAANRAAREALMHVRNARSQLQLIAELERLWLSGYDYAFIADTIKQPRPSGHYRVTDLPDDYSPPKPPKRRGF